MSTLITSESGGHRRDCNARCYNARGPVCDCVCGGINHGQGEIAAASNTAKRAAQILLHAPESKIVVKEIQQNLF